MDAVAAGTTQAHAVDEYVDHPIGVLIVLVVRGAGGACSGSSHSISRYPMRDHAKPDAVDWLPSASPH